MSVEAQRTLLEAFRAAYATVAKYELDSNRLSAFELLRSNTDPATIIRVDPQLRQAARDDLPWIKQIVAFQRARSASVSMLRDMFLAPGTKLKILEELARNANLARLLLHDPDGRIREAAVRTAPTTAPDAALLAVLLARANDWVEPVRAAALARLGEAVPEADVEAIARMLPTLLHQVPTWQRGGEAATELFRSHPAWPDAVDRLMLTHVNGPLARHLRTLLRGPQCDGRLPLYATSARSAFVRAVAAEVVLTGEARWSEGIELVWVDKSTGIKKRQPPIASRKVSVAGEDVAEVLASASRDRSAVVRRAAADDLVTHGPASNEEIADILASDSAPSVRFRMDYFARKWSA